MDKSRKRKLSDENLSEGPDRPEKAGTSGNNTGNQNELAVVEAFGNINEKALQSLPTSSLKLAPGTNVTLVKQNFQYVVKGDQVTAKNLISGSSNIKVVNQEGSTEADSKTDDPNQIPDSLQLSDSIFLLHKEKIDKLGNVCKGVQIHHGFGKTPIAIKSIRHSEKNEMEAKILVKLCPQSNVAQVIQSGVYEVGHMKYIYIAMEICGPQNLTEHVKSKKGKQNPDVKLRQIHQLVDGIVHIHKNDVIHRDLKPDNILFSTDGKYLKIIDFGLSKQITSGRSVTNVSTLRVGTDGWRAPETYNSDVISKATDIYSLALIIHFIETDGHHPFGDDPDEWNANIKKDRGLDLSKLEADSEIYRLLRWMLSFNPRDRPTADEVQKHKYFGGDVDGPSSTITRESQEIEARIEKKRRAIEKEYSEKIKALEKEMKQEKDEVVRKALQERLKKLIAEIGKINEWEDSEHGDSPPYYAGSSPDYEDSSPDYENSSPEYGDY
uniref:serine/threonine-protein kinase/endoribonuclease ire-1-like n=1 Tax=Styela clava TaxID=7725 RepID=UPI00193A4528|nr:serine/threonine-protein kinase/endoribonuclease ire-1-like [Styela clava]